MSTYKKTGPGGFDYAVPSPKRPNPPPAPPKPPVPPEDWGVYPFYPPYPEVAIEPVPTPPIQGATPPRPAPVEPSEPPKDWRPEYPPYWPVPPYPAPKPEKVDECSKKLAKLSQKAKVLVQMIKDFEQKNKPAILTIGNNSYQFGTENTTNFNGDAATGMYASLISGDPIEALEDGTYTVDDTKTRVALNSGVATDLLQTELARVRQEITLTAAALNDEVTENSSSTTTTTILGTGEGA